MAEQSDTAMGEVIWLSEVDDRHRPVVGSKAARLGTLLASGFPVPAGFCLTCSVYDRYVLHSRRLDLANLVARGDFSTIYNHVRHTELDHPLASQVLRHYQQLQLESPGPVAVRSSATAEDLARHSFAGLYETVLNVEGEAELLEAVCHCWASYWREEAVHYREQNGLNHVQGSMAVLLQAMIQPRLAGVLFTQDPIDQTRNALLVEFVEGGAESLVSGEAQANRVLMDRQTRRRLSPPEQVIEEHTSFLARLASMGLAIEEQLGGPQDIEWCLDKAGNLWIVQARPITATEKPQPPAQVDLGLDWRLAYDEPFSPLGLDLAIRRHGYWVRIVNDYYKTAFEPEVTALDGFLYSKKPWRSPASPLRLWMGFWKVARWLRAKQIHRHHVEVVMPTHRRRLTELEAQDLPSLDTHSLVVAFNAAAEMYLELQYASYPLIEVMKVSVSLLDRLCRLWLERDSGLRVSDLLTGLDNLTVKRDLALDRLGEILGGILPPDKVAELDDAALLALKDKDSAGRQFWADLQAFIGDYGYVWADRYPRDPAWRLDQDALLSTLKHIAQVPARGRLAHEHERQKERRARAVSKAARQLSSPGRFSFRWPVFRWVLSRAERHFPFMENRNHDVYRAMMVIRKHAQEIGARLAAKQILHSEQDVFFLTWDEIRQAAAGDVATPTLRAWISDRKQAHDRGTRRQPGQEVVSRSEGASASHALSPLLELVGEPCSPGVATGLCRLVSGMGELQRVQPGEIVVCKNMRPAWSSVFTRAGGVVVEIGSLLSHGATLAREYGVPAVMNVPGITQMACEGDRVRIDGYVGAVRIERAVPK
jgi:phosphohistidine swiveling domain-containing protein